MIASGKWGHMSMPIVLDDLGAIEGSCPYPSCQSSLERVPIHNGGRTWENCGRWAVITVPTRISKTQRKAQMPEAVLRAVRYDDEQQKDDSVLGSHEDEDIELYRHIHVTAANANPVRRKPPTRSSSFDSLASVADTPVGNLSSVSS